MEDGESTAVTHSRSIFTIAIMHQPYDYWGVLGLSTCIARKSDGGLEWKLETQVIPAEFKAAGLIVPDPSISSFPMPFNGLETEGVAWYIALGQRAQDVRPPRAVSAQPFQNHQAAAHKQAVTKTQLLMDGCVVCDAAMRQLRWVRAALFRHEMVG